MEKEKAGRKFAESDLVPKASGAFLWEKTQKERGKKKNNLTFFLLCYIIDKQ